jgi:predicted phage tail protein
MTTKNRIAQLEKQKPKATRREFTQADNDKHDRAISTLADALTDINGVPVTHGEVEKALKALNHDNKK